MLAKELLTSIADARNQFIIAASDLSYPQTQFKQSPDCWSIVDNVEHMVMAEISGVASMWKVFMGLQQGETPWIGERVHHGLDIETIIAKTWKEKEIVPEIAKPRIGGKVEYWIDMLRQCQPAVEKLVEAMEGHDLEDIIHPHAISGPLNYIQRLQFLRFHLNRHQKQIENIKRSEAFLALA